MKVSMVRQVFVVGIIFLFVGVGVSSTFSAQYNKNISKKNPNFNNKSFEFIVTEFKADGTKEDTIVKMTYEHAKNFIKDLKELKDQEEKLSLFKNYGLIPESVTLEQLKLGMENKAEINGLNEELFEKLGNDYFLNFNLFCTVDGVTYGFLRFLLGLSAITRVINTILWGELDIYRFIPSIDLLNCQIGGLDVFVKDGILADFHFDGLGITLMAGFVGYYVHGTNAPFFYLCPIFTFLDYWFGSAAFVGIFGKYQEFPGR